jgi:hypothetical protein
MMPVAMNLIMDQRQLPKLLVECANSNMPIEVKRVRILKSQSMPAPSGDPGFEISPYDVPVEIYGVIYIYNPPDRAKLGTGAASQEKPADGTAPAAPGTPPAAAPAAPTGAMYPYRKQGAEA